MTIVFERLPVWPGGLLAAEYDRSGDVIRVNEIAIARVRSRLGASAAERFVACAIAHERGHRDRPEASEEHVRAAMDVAYGREELARFLAVLRE